MSPARSANRNTEKVLPPRAEFERGSRLAIANSARLLKSSDLLAARELYGPATALLFTALEEAVKGWVLGVAGGIESSPKLELAIERQLRHHGPRYDLAAVADALRASDLLGEPDGATHDLPPPPEVHVLAVLALAVGFLVLPEVERNRVAAEVANLLMNSLVPAVLEMRPPDGSWFSQAENRRVAGLYVDWSPTGWADPGIIGPADHEEARRRVLPLLELVLDPT